MKQLNDSGGKILFVVNEAEKLIGTVTDGDIRRGIIKGYGFGDRIKGLERFLLIRCVDCQLVGLPRNKSEVVNNKDLTPFSA